MTAFSTVSIKDLQNLKGVSYRTAQRHYRDIAGAIGIQQIMVFQLAQHLNSPVEELLHALYPHLKK